jgi:hypothetical protein
VNAARAVILTHVLLGLGACGGPGFSSVDVHPVSDVGGQAAFSEYEEQWARGERLDVLRRDLVAWMGQHPRDPAATRASAYVSVLCALEGDFACARLHAQRVKSASARGASRDLVALAEARVVRMSGSPEAALELLRPLAGKWVDQAAAAIFLEELAQAALASHVEFEALGYLDAWLEASKGDDFEKVKARVLSLIRGLPRTVLEPSYAVMKQRGKESGYGLELRRLCAERLAEIAIETSDSNMARGLLEGTNIGMARELAKSLEELAVSTKGFRVVRGKTVGLLLPVSTTSLRDESAEVLRGVSFALGLSGLGRVTRLVTRDSPAEADRMEVALEELAGEGASLIIGGLEPTSAARLLAWGAASQMSVIALAAPSRSGPRADARPARGAILGLGAEEEARFIQASIASGAAASGTSQGVRLPSRWNLVFSDAALATQGLAWFPNGGGLAFGRATDCSAPDVSAGSLRFRPAVLERPSGASAASGWIVLGQRECMRDLAFDAARTPQASTVLASLEAGLPGEDVRLSGLTVLSVKAGLLPFLAASAGDLVDEDVRRYASDYASIPTYWAALGHDAGSLAAKALAPLPDDDATTDTGIYQRRATVEAGLVHAKVRFWTSEATSLSDKRHLDRKLSLVLARKSGRTIQ